MTDKGSARALLPLLVFIGLFLGVGIALTAQGTEYGFYQLPAPVALIPAVIIALIIAREDSQSNITTFLKGAGQINIMTMCLIYLLAGAFSSVAKATGSVDATVNLGLSILNADLLLPGLFVISAFMATAMGTSMGTIAAVAPIALGISQETGLESAWVAGAVLSGAMFGDNLSIISDTTIASTRTQGCEMKDKFRVNVKIALPAALIALAFFYWLSAPASIPDTQPVEWLGVLPYLLVLVLAVIGLNVFLVLVLGILLASFPGFVYSEYSLLTYGKDIYNGFTSMQEIFLLSMFIGGLSELIKKDGGLTWLTHRLQSLVTKLPGLAKHKANAAGIGLLAFCSNFCTANNTVSILISGDIAKDLAKQGNVSPRQSASLLDIFACISQGLLPYGAQVLLLGSTFGLLPWEVAQHALYCFILIFAALISIAVLKQEQPQEDLEARTA